MTGEWMKQSGIVALYHLEDVNDSNGSINLTNNNTVTFPSGKFNKCADFGASNTNKSLTVTNALGIDGGAISISLWVRCLAEIGANYWVFATQSADGTSKSFYGINYEYNSGTRRLGFYRTKQGVGAQGPTYNITLGASNWYNIVLTYDATSIKGYVNGDLVAGPTAASGNGSSSGVAFTGIGCEAGGASGFASSQIDEVVFFNRALSDREIKDYYNWSLGRFAKLM